MYSTLCTLELLHSYFADGRCRGLSVVPTADCAAVMARAKLLTRQVGNRFYLLIDSDASGKPLKVIDPKTVFRFYLIADEPDFFQYTELPFNSATNERLYLSNLAANQQNGKQYLNAANSAFAATTNYAPGDLATSGGALYECSQSVTANAGNVISDASHWSNRGTLSAPNAADLISWGSADEILTIPAPVATATVTVNAFNGASGHFDNAVVSQNLVFPSATASIPAPLANLPGDRYQVAVGATNQLFYHDPSTPARAVVGIVEIFNHLDAANAYSLVDAAGKAKGTVFTVNFLNPLVIWKYITRTTSVAAVRDASGVYTFDGSVPQVFRSTTPIPLTEDPYDQIALDYKMSSSSTTVTTYSKIINPSTANFKQITVGTDQLYCAEVYLNY